MDRLDFVYKNRLEPVVISDFDKVMTMYNLLKDYWDFSTVRSKYKPFITTQNYMEYTKGL